MVALLLVVLVACVLLPSLVVEATSSQPHIVFVLADDYGYNDVGYHGSDIKTPHLDALAASGVKLENYYVQPICSPTRSQLMSGRYQIHTGLQHRVIKPMQPNGLPLDSPTLADKLKESGYSTHMVGKWHLGFYKKEYLPWYRGFDTFYGYLNGAEDYFTHKRDGYLDLRTEQGPVRNASGIYSTELFTSKAVELVHNHDQKKPLFMYLAYQAVHGPLEVPDSYTQQYQHIKDKHRRIYSGMVSAMDEGVGNLTQALKDTGMWDNTVFIFSTDNGGSIHVGGNNFPLRGSKSSLFEGGVRGVGFVAGGVVPLRGQVSQELIHVSDWFPTLVAGVAGGNLNGTKPLDGTNQWNTISAGAASPRKELLHNIDPLGKKQGHRLYENTFDNRIHAAIRVGDMKLITGVSSKGKWTPPPDGKKYPVPHVHDGAHKNLWLFNITADPNEHQDLSGDSSYHTVVLELLGKLQDYQNTAVPCRFPPYDHNAKPRLHGGVWGPWM